MVLTTKSILLDNKSPCDSLHHPPMRAFVPTTLIRSFSVGPPSHVLSSASPERLARSTAFGYFTRISLCLRSVSYHFVHMTFALVEAFGVDMSGWFGSQVVSEAKILSLWHGGSASTGEQQRLA